MAREIELKFDLEPHDAAGVRTHRLFAADGVGDGEPRPLHAIYFDTPDQALRRAGLSLRIREEGRGRVQTVKSAGGEDGLLARGEWEAPLDADQLDFGLLAQTPLAPMLRNLEAELRPLFETRIERLTRTLRADGVEVELSLDQGEVATPDRRAPLNQLEIELKRGPPEVLFEVARELADAAPLRLSFETKAEAGYGLLNAIGDPVVKAGPVKLRKGMSVAQAFQAIARACLVQLTANDPVLRETRSPQALHQMRIAVRRLRAAISTFGKLVADGQSERVRSELKWLAHELNAARNLDVFLEETLAPAAERDPELEGLAELGLQVRRARTEAYDRALAVIGGQRYRTALLDTAAWLETGLWISAADATNRGLREERSERFAAAALERRRRSLKKRGKRLAKLDPEDRHELRIAAKKMRYAAEFFSELFDGRKAKRRRDRFIGALKALQDCLGKLNDIATGPETAANVLLHGHEPERRARAIFAAGRIVGARAAQERELIAASERAYDDFADASPFW